MILKEKFKWAINRP